MLCPVNELTAKAHSHNINPNGISARTKAKTIAFRAQKPIAPPNLPIATPHSAPLGQRKGEVLCSPPFGGVGGGSCFLVERSGTVFLLFESFDVPKDMVCYRQKMV